MRRSSVALVLVGFVFPLAIAACSSGGGGGFPAAEEDSGGGGGGDARSDAKRDARDGGANDDDPGTDDGALPKLDGSKSDASPTDAKVDSNEGGVPSGQCFDVGLGQNRAIVKPTAGQLVISEWMPDPTAVTDANGEWFELRATAPFDLNGVQVGSTSLGTGFSSSQCVEVAAGSFLLYAHGSADAGTNGLGSIPVDVVTTVNLVNSNGTLQVGVDNVALHTVTWTAVTPGKSIMIDGTGKQCVAPAGVAAYNGTDIGTPRAANTATCP